VLGGVVLVIAPFTSCGRVAPHWMRVALWMSCPIAIVWGALGFVLVVNSPALSDHAYFLVRHNKTFFGGMGVGILILLFASGEFIAAFKSRKAAAGGA